MIRKDAWYRDLCQARSAAGRGGADECDAKKGTAGGVSLDHVAIVAIDLEFRGPGCRYPDGWVRNRFLVARAVNPRRTRFGGLRFAIAERDEPGAVTMRD